MIFTESQLLSWNSLILQYESTIDLSGIPLSIFNETYNIGRLQPYQSIGSRFTTLNASNNKLVFKYITIYSNMTISDGTNSVTYIPESMFIHEFIHKMESGLNVNITLDII